MSKKIYVVGSSASFNNLHSNHMNNTGAAYASVPDNSAFSFTGGSPDLPFSWVVWIKRDGAATNNAIFGKIIQTSSNNVEWYVQIATNSLWFLVNNSTGAIFRGRTAPMATTGAWVGLAGTYDGGGLVGSFRLYTITGGTVTRIDTTNLTSGVYTGMTNGTAPLYLGALNLAGITRQFNGQQYHPQIYSGALNTTDLATIGASPHKDARLHSITSGTLISAWHYPNGPADFSTWTDYVAGRNATMQSPATSNDISTDIP